MLHLSFIKKQMKKKILTFCFIIALCSCEVVFVEDISKEQIVLVAPTNNSELTSGTIRFDWEGITEATHYRIQIATPDFEDTVQIVLDSTITTINISKELTTGDFQWRVKAINSDYETAYTTNSFSVN